MLRRAGVLALTLLIAVPGAAAAAERPPAPNDPYYSEQWALHAEAANGVDLLETWRFGQGAGIVVAVLDTGVTEHPEFAGRVLAGYDFISDLTRAGDGDGRDANPRDEGDWVTGQVLEALARNKLADNTLVIVTSDNGAAKKVYEHRGRCGITALRYRVHRDERLLVAWDPRRRHDPRRGQQRHRDCRDRPTRAAAPHSCHRPLRRQPHRSH